MLNRVVDTYSYHGFILLCNREGELYEEDCYYHDDVPKINGKRISRYVSVGDTVIVARDKKEPYIIRNLTMENKIRAVYPPEITPPPAWAVFC